MNRRSMGAWAVAALAAACTKKADVPQPAATLTTSRGARDLSQAPLEEGMRGISGVARTGDGGFWLVPERDRQLWRLAGDAATARPIVGAPDGVDLESAALVRPAAPGQPAILAFGTETTAERDADQIVFGQVFDDRVSIDATAGWSLAYAPWKITPGRNKGLEALCVAGDYLLAVSENVFEVDGERFAPVALRTIAGVRDGRVQDTPWIRRSLKLLSDDGKISAVRCEVAPGGLRAEAIERHFGVMHLIRFDVDPAVRPADPRAQTLTASLSADLGKAYPAGSTPPNFEGLGRRGADDILISDNDYGGVAGPTVILSVTE